MQPHYTKPARNFKDISGQRFGRLIAIERVATPSHIRTERKAFWRCICDCGQEEIVNGTDLRTGHIRSCGCLRDEFSRNRRTTHGMHGTSEYRTWHHMIDRCHNPNNPDFPEYGERGIQVCQQWQDSFSSFYADMGDKPTKAHSIDRKDNTLGYFPGNCRWATPKEQANNTRRNHVITYDGQTRNLTEWAKETGISCASLSYRLNNGWDIKKALTTPVRALKRK